MLRAPHPRLSSPTLGGTHPTPITDIATDMQHLVSSAEPAVVFSSLAHLCVPAFSDACTVDIVEQGDLAYRIAYDRGAEPAADIATGAAAEWSVSTPFTCSEPGDADGATGTHYAGVLTHRWRSRRPTAADHARAAGQARHCVATVAHERSRGARDGVDHLDCARADADVLTAVRR